VCVCVCVCVWRCELVMRRNTAGTSKHFVSISKMSKVREAMTILTTEKMFLKEVYCSLAILQLVWQQCHTALTAAVHSVSELRQQVIWSCRSPLSHVQWHQLAITWRWFLLCLCVMGVSVQYEAYQLLKVLLVPFLFVCSGPMTFFPQCQYYWVQHDEQISGFQLCIHAHRTLAERFTGKILVKMWFIPYTKGV